MDSIYDLWLEHTSLKIGLVLARDEDGATRFWPQLAPAFAPQIDTGEFSYRRRPSEIDLPIPFEHWRVAGIVDEVTPDEQDEPLQGIPTYYYSRGIDASNQRRLYLSPALQAVLENDATAIAAAPVQFADTSLGFFMLAGAYIYELDQLNGQWVQRDNASADGQSYTHLVEMDATLYAARGSSVDYKYSTDGITWTAFTDSDNNPSYWAVRPASDGSESQLFMFKADLTTKQSSNGANSGDAWSAADEVGHTSETLRGTIVSNDDMYVFKEEGFTRYDGSTIEEAWGGGVKMRRDTNGKQPFVWLDGVVYVPYGDRLLAYEPTGDGSVVNMRFIFPLPSMAGAVETNGTITAIAGDERWLYLAVKNAAGNTYVWKGNPYTTEWHTWTYLGANDCNAMLVAGPGTVHDDNPALVIGYGTAASYYILTRPGMRPEDDSNYRFDTGGGTLYHSWTAGGAAAFPKLLAAGRLVVENASAAKACVLKYEIDADGTETTLVTATSGGEASEDITTEVAFNRIRAIVTMASSDNTDSPVIIGAVLNTIPNPPRKRAWIFDVVVGDQVRGANGGQSRYSGRQLESHLFASVEKYCTLYDNRGRSFKIRVSDVQAIIGDPGDESQAYRVSTQVI